MASKQAVTQTKSPTAATATAPAAAAKPGRAAKPKAPRVSSAKHSKTTSLTEVVAQPVAAAEIIAETPVVKAPVVNVHEAISKIAYGYWAARGFQGGSAHEDWIRAENEFRASL